MGDNDSIRPVGPGNRVRPAAGGPKSGLQNERARPGRKQVSEEPKKPAGKKPKGEPGHIDEHV